MRRRCCCDEIIDLCSPEDFGLSGPPYFRVFLDYDLDCPSGTLYPDGHYSDEMQPFASDCGNWAFTTALADILLWVTILCHLDGTYTVGAANAEAGFPVFCRGSSVTNPLPLQYGAYALADITGAQIGGMGSPCTFSNIVVTITPL